MKARLAVLSMIVIGAMALSACSSTLNAAPWQEDLATEVGQKTEIGIPRVTAVDVTSDGHVVEVVAGSIVEITLESNPTTGFRWELAGPIDDRMLALIESEYLLGEKARQDPPVPGAGGTEVWTFETLAAGDTTVSLAYSRPWEGGEKGIQTFTVTLRCLSGRVPQQQ